MQQSLHALQVGLAIATHNTISVLPDLNAIFVLSFVIFVIVAVIAVLRVIITGASFIVPSTEAVLFAIETFVFNPGLGRFITASIFFNRSYGLP